MSEAIRDDVDSPFRARQVTRPRDQVEQQLREAIFSGKFAQGEQLPAETGSRSFRREPPDRT